MAYHPFKAFNYCWNLDALICWAPRCRRFSLSLFFKKWFFTRVRIIRHGAIRQCIAARSGPSSEAWQRNVSTNQTEMSQRRRAVERAGCPTLVPYANADFGHERVLHTRQSTSTSSLSKRTA